MKRLGERDDEHLGIHSDTDAELAKEKVFLVKRKHKHERQEIYIRESKTKRRESWMVSL